MGCEDVMLLRIPFQFLFTAAAAFFLRFGAAAAVGTADALFAAFLCLVNVEGGKTHDSYDDRCYDNICEIHYLLPLVSTASILSCAFLSF